MSDIVHIGPNPENYCSDCEFRIHNPFTGKDELRHAEDDREGREKSGWLLGIPVIFIENPGDSAKLLRFVPCYKSKQDLEEDYDEDKFDGVIFVPKTSFTPYTNKYFKLFDIDSFANRHLPKMPPPTARTKVKAQRTDFGHSYKTAREIIEKAITIEEYSNRIYYDSLLFNFNRHGYWYCTGCLKNFRGPGQQYHGDDPEKCPIPDKKTYIGNPDLVYAFGPDDRGDAFDRDTRKAKGRGRSLFENQVEVKKVIEIWNKRHSPSAVSDEPPKSDFVPSSQTSDQDFKFDAKDVEKEIKDIHPVSNQQSTSAALVLPEPSVRRNKDKVKPHSQDWQEIVPADKGPSSSSQEKDSKEQSGVTEKQTVKVHSSSPKKHQDKGHSSSCQEHRNKNPPSPQSPGPEECECVIL